MFRPTTLALRPVLRLACTGPRRLASTGVANPHPPTVWDKWMTPLKDPGIREGQLAYVWEVPKELPDNDFNMRRRAVTEHAACESVEKRLKYS